MTTEKKFDCLAFKRLAQLEIYEEIKDMTAKEQLEYFKKRAISGPLGSWWTAKENSKQERSQQDF